MKLQVVINCKDPVPSNSPKKMGDYIMVWVENASIEEESIREKIESALPRDNECESPKFDSIEVFWHSDNNIDDTTEKKLTNILKKYVQAENNSIEYRRKISSPEYSAPLARELKNYYVNAKNIQQLIAKNADRTDKSLEKICSREEWFLSNEAHKEVYGKEYKKAFIADEESDYWQLHAYSCYLAGYEVIVSGETVNPPGSQKIDLAILDYSYRPIKGNDEQPNGKNDNGNAGGWANDPEEYTKETDSRRMNHFINMENCKVFVITSNPKALKKDLRENNEVIIIEKPSSSIMSLVGINENEERCIGQSITLSKQYNCEKSDDEGNGNEHAAEAGKTSLAANLYEKALEKKNKAETLEDYLKAAALALDGFLILGGKTPTLSAQLLFLRHQCEVSAELSAVASGLYGVAKNRLKLIREEINTLNVSSSRKKELLTMFSAALEKQYRSAGHIEEADECLECARVTWSTLKFRWIWFPMAWLSSRTLRLVIALVILLIFGVSVSIWASPASFSGSGSIDWNAIWWGVRFTFGETDFAYRFKSDEMINNNWYNFAVACFRCAQVFLVGTIISTLWSKIARK